MGEPLAVVDVGSNSLRLFLADVPAGAAPEGPRTTTIVGLRRGAGKDGHLADEAIDRLRVALVDVAAAIAAAEAKVVVAVGTSAVREAPDGHRVEDAVSEALGVPLQVIAGAVEARLAFAGARLGVPDAGECVVVDIGGGSTELVRGGLDGVESAVSLRLGAVRHTEGFLHTDPPTDVELHALRRSVRDELGAIGWGSGEASLVGVAGTITTLAAIELGGYDRDRVHRHVLSRERVGVMLDDLASMTAARRRTVPGLEPARAAVIVAGAAILAEVMDAARAEALTVSERDLLDGVALAVNDRVPGADIVPTMVRR